MIRAMIASVCLFALAGCVTDDGGRRDGGYHGGGYSRDSGYRHPPRRNAYACDIPGRDRVWTEDAAACRSLIRRLEQDNRGRYACNVPGRERVWTQNAEDCRRLIRRLEDERRRGR